jgi:hydrogenase maturation protein HypF
MEQGMGFRPYIFSLARRRALRGHVFDNALGVLIDVEGDRHAVEQFIREIKFGPPPLSQIETAGRRHNPDLANFLEFRIVGRESIATGGRGARKPTAPLSAPLVPVDIAPCADCLWELFDARDRRHLYPFINCAHCGPRFTIIEGMPYDRGKTTMRDFAMCGACRAEYEAPLDRRYQAESTSCAMCGPRLYLTDARGRESAGGADPVDLARDLLLDGRILAVKGVGGFHLACNALDAEAVRRLRRRKFREDKPFALMAGSIEEVERYCFVTKAGRDLLTSAARPITLLDRKPGPRLPGAVSPGLNTLGFMLPSTPLHYLLLDQLDVPLVMTGGNLTGEPLCSDNREAINRLGDIADYFLLHDLRIHTRADDSVARPHANGVTILRRARGYAPQAIKTPFKFAREILACGAGPNSAFCLARDDDAFLWRQIGDAEDPETPRSFGRGIERFNQLINLRPEVVAHDLRPEYISTRFALSLGDECVRLGVQHHHAHVAACMVDNRVDGEVIGVAMDGLGYGTDGRFWGGEFFVADYARAERVAHLEYTPMPGGAQAIREPWRMAATYLYRALGENLFNLNLDFVSRLDRRAWWTLRQMVATGVNCPESSSMGRLFDAVASLVGVRDVARYEGQAAMELEAQADEGQEGAYEFDCSGKVIGTSPLIRGLVSDLVRRVPTPVIAGKFHNAVATLILRVARRIGAERGLRRVALSGGVFQNRLLLNRVTPLLANAGFEVFTHRRAPSGDGGVALGQAAVANALIRGN